MCQYSQQIPCFGTSIPFVFIKFYNKQIIYFKSPAVNKLAFYGFKVNCEFGNDYDLNDNTSYNRSIILLYTK